MVYVKSISLLYTTYVFAHASSLNIILVAEYISLVMGLVSWIGKISFKYEIREWNLIYVKNQLIS